MTQVAVDLIRGYINESAYAAVHPAGLQQHMRAVGVVDGKGQAVAEAVVHMRLHVSTQQAHISQGQLC